MTTPETNDGLLFVYAEPGPEVTADDANLWYDTEHAPARLTVPGISSAARYKTTDGKAPTWLALYDLANPQILETDAYKNLSIKASPNEKTLISRLTTLHRRVYSHITTLDKPGVDTTSSAAKFILVVGLQPTKENEEDVNNWYANEHLALLSKVPGFLRARRYKLVSDVELAGNSDRDSGLVAYPYIAIYDLETSDFMKEPSLHAAIGTAWSSKVLGAVTSSEIRLFALHKSFTRQSGEETGPS